MILYFLVRLKKEKNDVYRTLKYIYMYTKRLCSGTKPQYKKQAKNTLLSSQFFVLFPDFQKVISLENVSGAYVLHKLVKTELPITLSPIAK